MVDRIIAVAKLDERPAAADAMRSRASSGDADSAWLLEQWAAGRLVLASVTVTVWGERAITAERTIEGVWIEREDLPGVERQIAEVAPTELGALAEDLRARGVDVEDDALDASFVHVELDERLLRELVGV